MKHIILAVFLCSFFAGYGQGNDTTKYFKDSNYGTQSKRQKVDSVLMLPNGTIINRSYVFPTGITDTTTRFGGVKTIYKAYLDSVVLAAAVGLKLNISDSLTKYVTPKNLKDTSTVLRGLATTNATNIATNATNIANEISRATAAELLKLNISDSLTKYVTPKNLKDTSTVLRGLANTNASNIATNTTNISNEITRATAAELTKLDTVTGTFLKTVTLSNTGVIHNAPTYTYNNTTKNYTITQTLATQAANKVFGTGNASATPTFRDADSLMFGGGFARQVRSSLDTNLINTRKFYGNPKLSNWFKKISTDPTNAKMIFVGNSTSDFTSNALNLKVQIKTYCVPGQPLFGLDTTSAQMPNFGTNGQTIVGFFNDSVNTASRGIAGVIAAAPDLIIFSYGINDVRQNQLTKDQLKNYVIACINKIRTALPNTDIVLRMPNSFLTSNAGGFIQQGGYASIAVAAQAQSQILYKAYKELENYWDNVVLFNSQDLIFGQVAQSTSNLMSDGIHPTYDRIAREIVNIIGYKAPYSEGLAQDAMNRNYQQPYSIYKRALENTKYYQLKVSGSLNGYVSGSYIDINVANSSQVAKIFPNDIISIGDSIFVVFGISNTGMAIRNTTTIRYLSLAITSGLPINSTVKIYRPIYNNNIKNEEYLNNNQTYTYRRRVVLFSGGTNFFDIDAAIDDSLTYSTPNLTPAFYQLSPSDVLVVDSFSTVQALTTASISPLNTNTLRVFLTGSFSAYAGKAAYIYGNHPYEDAANTTKNYPIVGTFNSGTVRAVANGDFGISSNNLFIRLAGVNYQLNQQLPLTTTGDIIYSSSGSTAARLPIGAANQVLTVSGGIPTWVTRNTAIAGTTTNDAAVAGNLGENVESEINTATNYTTTATYQAVTSITLTAGDWDLSAIGTFNTNTATITAAANAIFVVSTTTASATGATAKNTMFIPQAALLGTSAQSSSSANYRVSIAGTTTFFLNTQATFTLGNPQYTGFIRARRMR